jgi:predicted MFS family arabinose efflux permease
VSWPARLAPAVLWVLFAANFILVLDFVVMMPLGPELMRVFEISTREFAWLVSSYTLAAACASLLGILVIDRIPRRTALLSALAGLGLTTLACAASPDFWSLLWSRFAAGAFGGLTGTLIFTWISEQIPEHRRGRATAHVSSAFPLASILGIPFAVALAQHWNWHWPFALLGVLSLIVWCVAFRFLPAYERPLQSRKLKDFWTLLKDPNHLRALALTFCLLMSAFLMIPFLSPYLVKNVGLEESKLPWVYFFGGLATIVVQRVVGWSADYFGKHRTFWVMALLSLVPMLILPRIEGVSTSAIFVTSSLFMSIVSGRFIPAVAILGTAAHSQNKGAFLSLNSVVHHGSAAVAPVVASLVITQNSIGSRLEGFESAVWIAAALTVLATVIAQSIQNRDR